MHNLECNQQNVTHKILEGFDIQIDHQILTRRPDQGIINKIKRTCRILDIAVPVDHRMKIKESKKKIAGELKTIEHEGDSHNN